MISIKTLAASYTLSAKLDPEKCEHLIQKLPIKRTGILDYVYPNNIKAAVVQMKLSPFKDFKSFVQECCRLIDTGVQGGSHIIVFPHLLGLLPVTVDKGACEVTTDFLHDLLSGKTPAPALQQRFRQMLDRFGDFLFDCYYNLFLLLAHRYNVYIAAGSIYVCTSQGIYCRSYLFSPDHEEAFFQDKIHLNPVERQLGVVSGNELHIIPLKVGNVAILADTDCSFYECHKVAKALGAQIILSPSLCSESLSHIPEYNASRMQAQHFNLYNLRSSFFSDGKLVAPFSGASGIYAPLSLSKSLDGIIAHTQEGEGESQVLVGRIEPPKLSENLDVYSFSTNAAFCNCLMNTVYPAYFSEEAPSPSADTVQQPVSPPDDTTDDTPSPQPAPAASEPDPASAEKE